VIGKVGSVAGTDALAMLRLDRAAEAKAKGQPLLAAGVPIALRKVAWFDPDRAVSPVEAAP
jgi:hypothetical protein